MTRTITINPENWIDDKVEVTIDGGTIKVRGETLTMKEGLPIIDQEKIKYDCRSIKVFWNGNPNYAFCKMIKFGDETVWTASRNGIERRHSNPAILAAIMACNLI